MSVCVSVYLSDIQKSNKECSNQMGYKKRKLYLHVVRYQKKMSAQSEHAHTHDGHDNFLFLKQFSPPGGKWPQS